MDLRTRGGRGKLRQSESSIDIYTLPNVKMLASGKQPHSTGRSAPCFVMTHKEDEREGIWGYMYAYG